MQTTKKVDPKAVSVKKDIKVLTVAKKKVLARTEAKKVPVPKKSIKINIQDKTVATPLKKKVTPDTHSKKLHSKFTTLEALHSKNQTQITKNEKTVTTALAKRVPLGLSKLSLYRFPLDIHTKAIATARYSGIFFVILGAIFTLFFANGAFSVQGQMAQLTNTINQVVSTSSTTQSPSTTTTLNCQDPLIYQSLSCKDVVDTTPSATFDILNRESDLKGTVKIKVNVLYAQRVKLMALNKNDGTSVEIGLMKNVSPETWEFYWNTSIFKDGTYRLRVLVQNAHGSYENIDTSNVIVENTPYENGLSSTSSTQILQASTTNVQLSEDVALKPKLTANTLQSASEFRFEIIDPRADSIKVYALHVPTAKKIFLGNMYASTNDMWKYRWLVSTQEAGEYKVTAQILTDGVPTYSSELVVNKVAINTTDGTLAQTLLPVSPEIVLDPEVLIVLPSKTSLSQVVPVQIEVANAALIELYIQGKSSLVKKFLGVATLLDVDTWSYRFDSKQVPNGEYILIAIVRNMYGTYEHKTQPILISNTAVATYTPVQIDQMKALEAVAVEAGKLSSTSRTTPVETAVKPPAVQDGALPQSGDAGVALNPLMSTDQNESLQAELNLLANALRLQDTALISEIKARILSLKESERTASTSAGVEDQQRVVALDSYIRGLILETEEAVFRTDKLIAERTKEKANEDTDKDGVSNYDEVVIYKTDPYLSDTDNDGFGDAAEILSGYNPTDAKPEALVSYQSPKEAGIVREDILAVTSITTELHDEDVKDIVQKRPVALISGTALPNSFITLYIFSTPIVVTLKTDEDGGWNYRFDKELEDGQHEVYIGVTDNAGKIVAKSNPFSFVKEAEAFTGVSPREDAQPTPVLASPSTFLGDYMVYLVLSISTVAIGLVLILLGLHLDSRQRKFGIMSQNKDALV